MMWCFGNKESEKYFTKRYHELAQIHCDIVHELRTDRQNGDTSKVKDYIEKNDEVCIIQTSTVG